MNTKPSPFDTVSSATLRDSDLMRAMVDTLKVYRPKKYKQLIADCEQILDFFGDWGYISYLYDFDFNDFDTDKLIDFNQWLSDNNLTSMTQVCEHIDWIINESLPNAMQDIAPANCYYGSHPGDGALMGFWPVEDSSLWE